MIIETFSEFSKLANRTVKENLSWEQRLENATLGIVGEAGEIADHVKKYKFHGHKLEPKHLAKEIGDELWYLNLLAETIGYSLEDIASIVIEKLKSRYPEGFSEYNSINRKEYV